MGKPKKARQGPELPPEYKMAALQERMRGTKEEDVAQAFGVQPGTIAKWMKQFRDGGFEALRSKRSQENGSRKKPAQPSVKREQVVALKKKHETWGTRRISDVLARFEGLGVSETQVRRILHEAGLIESPTPARSASTGRVGSSARPRTSCGSRTSLRSGCVARSGCTCASSWTTTVASSSDTHWRTIRSPRS